MGKKKICIVALALLFLIFSHAAARLRAGYGGQRSNAAIDNGPSGRSKRAPQRIVSLAPSVTETLFLLGLGDRVAGVTRYCIYPDEARSKAVIGSYSEPNYEAIYALKPEIVVMLTEHREEKRRLEKLGLSCLCLDNRTVPAIIQSIENLGRSCGKEPAARKVVRDMKERMARIEKRTAGRGRPRVLVGIGGYMETGRIGSITVAGENTFYDDLIRCAGGVNAYHGPGAYPILSREGLIRLNPEIVLIMEPEMKTRGLDEAAIRREWAGIPEMDAVRKGRIHVLGQPYVVVPGPRFILILEEMARLIHPGLEEK